MKITKTLFLIFLLFISFSITIQAGAANSKRMIFREYIGASFNGVTFSDVPISPKVDEFHFLLSFAIDYKTTASSEITPTNGDFQVYWDTENLSPDHISSIKSRHSNVKVAMSLGGDTLLNKYVFFHVQSIDSWIANAVKSIIEIFKEFELDGIDIDYKHFDVDADTFAECIEKLLVSLKKQKVVSFVSIAPFAAEAVQEHYIALWKKYGEVIEYVNFQFYAYEKGISVSQFLTFFEEQRSNYEGGRILASIGSDGSGGLSRENGFFEACGELKSDGKLAGIFIWSADNSMESGFPLEKQSQDLLET